jgi:hypothetical protein
VLFQSAEFRRYIKKEKSFPDFESALTRLGVCHTIEEFWQYYVYMRRASELAKDSKLHLFRGSSAPMWEVCFASIVYFLLSLRRIIRMVVSGACD